MNQSDREVDVLRRRFIEGLVKRMKPAALRRFVVTGLRPDDERSGSGRKPRAA